MKHTLLNVWGFFPYVMERENDITMETSLGFRHFPIESSLVEESFGQARYQNDTHQSTWQKNPQNLCQVSWDKKDLPLELLSPRSPKTPKTDRSFLGVHTGILRICSKVSKRSKPPTFVLEWIPGGICCDLFHWKNLGWIAWKNMIFYG